MLTKQQLLQRKWLPIGISLLLTAIFTWFFITGNPTVHRLIKRLDYIVYDWRLNANLTEVKEQPVVIVDIDSNSLAKVGRWPWPRKEMAKLVKQLQDAGAIVIAFDVLFAEPEANVAEIIIDKLKKETDNHSKTVDVITRFTDHFDHDNFFAKQLSQGDSVLGMIFEGRKRTSLGQLPKPILLLNEKLEKELAIFDMRSYTTAIPSLQKGAKYNGFMTIIPDEDGVIRRASLLLRFDEKVYPSLALEAVRLYLLMDKIHLDVVDIGGQSTLEGIKLGRTYIPTDRHGQILIPFLGRRASIPTLSALSVLQGNFSKKMVESKLVIIGSSDISLGDVKATPVGRVFPGVEIQATIASGLFQKALPSVPEWARGIEFLIIVLLGLFLSILFPLINIFWVIVLSTSTLVGLVFANIYLWQVVHLAVPVALPFLLVFSLSLFNLTYGFIAERSHRRQLKAIFDQYVPPAHIDEMIQSEDTFGFEGESREMTVLFADIRNFTKISEKMNVVDLKNLLNNFFTEITNVILAHDGTIDKYVGDMVMAFWGAPLKDVDHANHAIAAALEMLTATQNLKPTFKKLGLPEINIGVGINTGIMNIGDMGSTFRRNYTVLGDAVNLASRLESITKYYTSNIIVSEATAKDQPEFVFRQLDRIRVKGREEALKIYQPIDYTKQITDASRQELDKHQAMLNHYFAQEWDESQKLCQSLQDTNPDVRLYQIYLERITTLKENPPGADWDGVYTFTSK